MIIVFWYAKHDGAPRCNSRSLKIFRIARNHPTNIFAGLQCGMVAGGKGSFGALEKAVI